MTQTTMDINKRIEQYIKLRDMIKKESDEFKERIKPKQELLEKLGDLLLSHLNTIGGDNVKSASGTVYKIESKSATIADGAAFRRWVIGGEMWDIVDWRCNAPAIQTFIDEHGQLPPGVNFSVSYKVGVRRA